MSVDRRIQVENSSEEQSSVQNKSQDQISSKEEQKKQETNDIFIDAMHWGFHEPNMFLLNGRLQTLAHTKSFRDLVDSQRCVVSFENKQVPINGYFEWQERANLQKIPYFIHLSDKEQPMFLAGLYKENKNDQTSDILRYCVLLTTASIGQISGIHHRMPVLLTDYTKEFWLDSQNSFKQCLAQIVKTPLSDMNFYQVPQLVNSVRNQGEDVILPVNEYKEKKKKAFFGMYQKKQDQSQTQESPEVSPTRSEGAGESFAMQRRKETNRKQMAKLRNNKSHEKKDQKLMTNYFKRNN